MRDKINNVLDCMDEDKFVEIWNEFCDRNRYEDTIYDMSSFDFMYETFSPLEIAELIDGEDFCARDRYFMPTLYGIRSADDARVMVDTDDLARYIEREHEDFGCEDLRVLFEEEE